MAKFYDILLDPDTGDVMTDTHRNRHGLVDGGLMVGDVTYQNQAIILQANKGDFKEYPTLGVGLADMINDDNVAGWRREIVLQLEGDGMSIKSVKIDNDKKLTIDAGYGS